jgi:hypothetical protein
VSGRGGFTHTAYNDFEIVAANLLRALPGETSSEDEMMWRPSPGVADPRRVYWVVLRAKLGALAAIGGRRVAADAVRIVRSAVQFLGIPGKSSSPLAIGANAATLQHLPCAGRTLHSH